MNPTEEVAGFDEPNRATDMERLLAAVAADESGGRIAPSLEGAAKENNPAHEFANPTILTPRELRKLRTHQENFASALAARLSVMMRLEFSVKLARLRTISYQHLVEGWAKPSHLTLFKLEPLRGISVLEISPRLGMAMVDRLMGGAGEVGETVGEISEIEKALLEQVVQAVLGEWCAGWSKLKELKPVLLECETNGQFIQIAARDATMLVVALECRLKQCTAQIEIGFPHSMLEALIRQLSQGSEGMANPPAPQPAPAGKWNPAMDEVCVPLTAEWEGLELTARELVHLQVGDVLQLEPQWVRQVKVRLGDLAKYNARLGTVGGKWAMELTDAIKT